MEALNPPQNLERVVLALIPPCAREAVAGDLCETYQNPRQYLGEALRTVPHVVFSQMRRNLNLPALMLQTALVWLLLGGRAAAIVTPLLVLREAWRPLARPSATHAIRETMAVALLAMVVVQGLSFDNGMMHQLGLGYAAWTSLYFFGFLVAPLLCFLRTGLIVSSDRAVSAPQEQTATALARNYRALVRRIRRRNGIEAAALGFAAVALAALGAAPVLIAVFALTGVFLLVHGLPAARTGQADFPALRALYQQALDRQQKLRRFLCWLWFAPVLLVLHERLIAQGLTAARSIPAILGAATALLLCFLVAAFNREQSGRTQEDIGDLDRLREIAPG